MSKFAIRLLTLTMYATSLPVIAMITPTKAATSSGISRNTKSSGDPASAKLSVRRKRLSRVRQARSAQASPEASIAGYGLLQSMRILIGNGAAAVAEMLRAKKPVDSPISAAPVSRPSSNEAPAKAIPRQSSHQ